MTTAINNTAIIDTLAGGEQLSLLADCKTVLLSKRVRGSESVKTAILTDMVKDYDAKNIYIADNQFYDILSTYVDSKSMESTTIRRKAIRLITAAALADQPSESKKYPLDMLLTLAMNNRDDAFVRQEAKEGIVSIVATYPEFAGYKRLISFSENQGDMLYKGEGGTCPLKTLIATAALKRNF